MLTASEGMNCPFSKPLAGAVQWHNRVAKPARVSTGKSNKPSRLRSALNSGSVAAVAQLLHETEERRKVASQQPGRDALRTSSSSASTRVTSRASSAGSNSSRATSRASARHFKPARDAVCGALVSIAEEEEDEWEDGLWNNLGEVSEAPRTARPRTHMQSACASARPLAR